MIGNNDGIYIYAGSKNTITNNNFISNNRHAFFEHMFANAVLSLIPILVYRRNYWNNNYWDDWTTPYPRPIRGEWTVLFGFIVYFAALGPVPYWQFDWHPAQKPYDIPGIS